MEMIGLKCKKDQCSPTTITNSTAGGKKNLSGMVVKTDWGLQMSWREKGPSVGWEGAETGVEKKGVEPWEGMNWKSPEGSPGGVKWNERLGPRWHEKLWGSRLRWEEVRWRDHGAATCHPCPSVDTVPQPSRPSYLVAQKFAHVHGSKPSQHRLLCLPPLTSKPRPLLAASRSSHTAEKRCEPGRRANEVKVRATRERATLQLKAGLS